MTELSEHAKSILRAMLDGKKIELQSTTGEWCTADFDTLLAWISIPNRLRIAPETRSINGVTFLAPVGSDIGGYCFDKHQYTKLQSIAVWESLEARNTAFSAIIDALNGVTK